MKKLIFVGLFLALLIEMRAASIPVSTAVAVRQKPGSKPSAQQLLRHMGIQKPTRLQLLAARMAQKKIQRKVLGLGADRGKQQRTLSVIALVAGLLGALSIFVVPVLALLLGPAALVTGIISLKNNTDSGSRTMGIIGLILGAATIVALFLYLVLAISTLFSFF